MDEKWRGRRLEKKIKFFLAFISNKQCCNLLIIERG